MATEDDKNSALDTWENQPWEDQCCPERDVERAGDIWRRRCKDAFCAGYDAAIRDVERQRAGEPPRGVAEPWGVKALSDRVDAELCKIRDRINALETTR